MGRKSPHGFTTRAEYQRWYYQNNKEIIAQKKKKYWEENRERLSEIARIRYRANFKPKLRDPNTYTYKYVYKVKENDVEEFRGVGKAAEQLFIGVKTIRDSIKLRKGYCKCLDCYFVISKEKLSDEEVLNILKIERSNTLS